MEGEQVIVLYTDFLVTQYGIMVKRPMTAHNEAGFLQWCVTVRFCRGELPQKQRRVEVAAEGWRPLMAPDIDFVLPLSEPVDLQRLHLRPALPCSARILNRFFLCRFPPQSVQHRRAGGARSSASCAANGRQRTSRMPFGHLIGCGVR